MASSLIFCARSKETHVTWFRPAPRDETRYRQDRHPVDRSKFETAVGLRRSSMTPHPEDSRTVAERELAFTLGTKKSVLSRSVYKPGLVQ
jgi:hypothetical protein